MDNKTDLTDAEQNQEFYFCKSLNNSAVYITECGCMPHSIGMLSDDQLYSLFLSRNDHMLTLTADNTDW